MKSANKRLAPGIALAVAMLATMSAVSGCSGSGSGAGAGGPAHPSPVVSEIPGVTSTPSIFDTAQVSLPIDAYVASGSDLEQTLSALAVLEKRCVSRFGLALDYPAPNLPGFGKNTRRYGVPESLDAAQKFGFHMPKNDPRSAPPTPKQILSQDVQKVLTGASPQGQVTDYHGIPVPQGGCVGEADHAISGSADIRAGHADAAEEIKAHSFEYSKMDPRVIAAQTAWATCMNAHGYTTYKESFDAGGDSRWNVPVATSQEITVAVTDWQCAKDANLVGIWVAVETAYQNKQIELHAQELRQGQDNLRAQAQRVTAIVSGAGPAPSS